MECHSILNVYMRFSEVDSLKGIAILGVIYAHMTFSTRFDISAIELISSLNSILGWCVLAFFFASGLLCEPIKNFSAFMTFVKNRSARLLIPCVVFSLTYKILLIFLSRLNFFSWYYGIPPFSITGIVEFVIFPVGPQFYFLYYLFGVSVLYAFLEIFISRKFLSYLFIILLPLTYYLHLPLNSPHGPSMSVIPLYVYAYNLGVVFSVKSPSFSRWHLLALAMSISLFLILDESLISMYVFVPVVLWRALREFPAINSMIQWSNFGKYSGAIYVWHCPLLMPFISILVVKTVGGGLFAVLLISVFTIFSCVSLAFITNRFVALKYWRF